MLAALKHRDYAYFTGAFTTSSIGSWAYNVALVVWLIDTTHSPGWVAAATTGRFVPSLVMSAYGGVIAERFERVRLMVLTDLLNVALMVALAVEMAVGAHPAWVVLTAAATTTVSTVYSPAAAALTPQLVPEKALGGANALRNAIDNICVIAGPALGALLLLVASESTTVLVNAGTYLVSALLTARISVRSTPVDVTEGGEVGPVKQMLVGLRTITESSSVATLVAFSVIATFVFGIDSVLFVVVSEDVLGTGSEGYGYLLTGLGIGGVAAAGLVTRLERLPRLGTVILLGMMGYCLPTLLFLFVDQPAVAFVAQVVRGASTLVVDVLAITALQRSIPSDRLGRVFGAFDGLCLLAIVIGSALVPLALDAVGLDAVLWASGLGIPVLCLLGLPWLQRMDGEAVARRNALRPKTDLLRRCGIFGAVSEGALEQLAGDAGAMGTTDGQVVVSQGDPADSFYVIVDGTFTASARGDDGSTLELTAMGPGSYFGEIGLLEQIPRTATVVSSGPGQLLRIDGSAFLAALTQEGPSAAFLDGASLRLSRTHPSQRLTRAALADDA